jgi:hypothetical protein
VRPALLALLLAACSPSAGEDVDAATGGVQCVPGSGFDINGTAGVLATLNVHINASGLVDTEASAALLLLLDIVQTGQDVTVVARPCDIEIPDVPVSGQDMPVHFDLGPGLIASVHPVNGTAQLDGLSTCASFTSAPITLLVGARLSPPDRGTLPQADSDGNFVQCQPTSADCYTAITSSCACDQELDGEPGATLVASNVPGIMLDQVYVNLRSTFSLTGQVFSSDSIQGEVAATLEQGILGCHKAGAGACSAEEVQLVKNLNPVVTPGEDPSVFRAVRVDPALTCDQLKDMRDQLFPR